MDFIVIIVLIALAFPVIAIIALVQASSLGGVVRRLELRVIALERTVAASAAGAATRPPAAAPVAGARCYTATTSTSRYADRASGSAARAAGCAAGERRSARAGADAIIAAADQL